MSRVIWTLPVPTYEGLHTVVLPGAAQILTVAVPPETPYTPCVWFECDPESPVQAHLIETRYTGSRSDAVKREYLSTVFLPGGIVLHYFTAWIG